MGYKKRRWIRDEATSRHTPNIDDFIEEIIAICEKHKLSISHEDGHGSFLIEETDEDNYDWLRNASLTKGNLDKEK